MPKFGPSGTPYHLPSEVWEPTMHLAFFREDDDGDNAAILHQQWQSNIGNVMWRPVVEMQRRNKDHS